MIHIAGGAYFECCDEPYWQELFGSGVRAAASLSGLTSDIKLSTYVDQTYAATLKAKAASYGFAIEPSVIGQVVSFYYTHGLSVPLINPHPIKIPDTIPLKVEAENILRFGLIEGSAVVHGDNVVYDPQSAYGARPFEQNGSTAKRLAIVANYIESAALSGEVNIEKILSTLLAQNNVEVVVIKQGAKGAIVATSKARELIPVYETDYVWPLGSGDVFSAHFAYRWAKEGMMPVEAAVMASKAAAVYCNSMALPVPKDYSQDFGFAPVKTGVDFSAKKVYLAGPFFNMSQRWQIKEALLNLRGIGFNVFSPFHDVGTGSAHDIYKPDIEALNESDIVFACLDGLDSGTLFEIGYAIARGTPVIVYVQSESEGDLKMIEGSPCFVCSDFCTAIYKTAWVATK